MSKLVWDADGEHFYETGCDRGVLFPFSNGAYEDGVAWNGLIGVSENPSGADTSKIYADNNTYLIFRSREEFAGTIRAYQSPEEFDECDGTVHPIAGVSFGQQTRKRFGLSYRTLIGNDEDFEDHGYKIHIVYGATAAPTERSYETTNESPEAMELSWDFETLPIKIEGYKPFAHIEIDSRAFTGDNAAKLTRLENTLYGVDAVAGTNGSSGTEGSAPTLPDPLTVVSLLSSTTTSSP